MIKSLKKHFCLYRKVTSIFLCLSLMLPINSSFADSASNLPLASRQTPLIDLANVHVPEEIGNIQESFRGNGNKTVFLIQDAHAIPSAQRNIQRLIDYFQKQYGVNLVALEGANAQLDPEIFKSFPDKELLKKVFKEYQERGEVTGGTASAIFNEKDSVYQGIEDWNLYEEGINLYLEAMEKESQILPRIKNLKQTLENQKKKIYSETLLEIDKTLDGFYKNSSSLLEVLQKLATIQEPIAGSELALLFHESKQQDPNNNLEREVKRIAQKVESVLKSNVTTENGKSQLREFNTKYQEFQTSSITPQAFSLFLKELAAKHWLPIKVSGLLSHSIKNQKRMQEIKGKKLFTDFEQYAETVKNFLIKSKDQRELNEQTKRLRIYERLAQLELSREDWNEIKKLDNTDAFLTDNASLLAAHLAFYRNSEKRDAFFSDRLASHMHQEEARSAILVAGGFHTEGLTHRLKDQDISYLLLMPRIDVVPEETNYRAHMKGEVSWKNNFEIQNGKINLYKAFVRGARDRLLKATKDKTAILKTWRDQIILDLANKNEISKAGQYTAFIDEVTTNSRSKVEISENSFQSKWKNNIERFIQDFIKLKRKDQLTEKNVLELLQPSAIPEWDVNPANMVPGSYTRAFRQSLPAVIFSPRSEVRSQENPEQRREELKSPLQEPVTTTSPRAPPETKNFFKRNLPYFYIYMTIALDITLTALFATFINWTASNPIVAIANVLMILLLNYNLLDGFFSKVLMLAKPVILPELNLNSIPNEYKTVAYYPILFKSKEELDFFDVNLIPSIEANNDPNIKWVIFSTSDAKIRELERERILQLQEKYGKDRIFYIHRDASIRNWEKKRGGYMHFMLWLKNSLYPGGTLEADPRFPSMPVGKVFDEILGDISALKGVRDFAIGDSDTIWTEGSIKKIVSKIHHPANERYGIFQSRVAPYNENESILTRFGVYFFNKFRARGESLWKVLRQVSFIGHGAAWEIDRFLNDIAGNMREGYPSHDIVESVFSKAALLSDVTTLEEIPPNFFLQLKQWWRWWLGNKESLIFLTGKVQDETKNWTRNPATLIDKFLLFLNSKNYLAATVLTIFIFFNFILSPFILYTNLGILQILYGLFIGFEIYGSVFLGDKSPKQFFRSFQGLVLFSLLMPANTVRISLFVIKSYLDDLIALITKRKEPFVWAPQSSLPKMVSLKESVNNLKYLVLFSALTLLLFHSYMSYGLYYFFGSLLISPFTAWLSSKPPSYSGPLKTTRSEHRVQNTSAHSIGTNGDISEKNPRSGLRKSSSIPFAILPVRKPIISRQETDLANRLAFALAPHEIESRIKTPIQRASLEELTGELINVQIDADIFSDLRRAPTENWIAKIEAKTPVLVGLDAVRNRTSYWIGLLKQLQGKKLNISVRISKKDNDLSVKNMAQALIKSREEIDRVVIAVQDGNVSHDLTAILKKNGLFFAVLKTLAKFNVATLTNQAALPVVSKDDQFNDLKVNQSVFGVGVADAEGISDPLLEGAESVLQVVVALLLADRIKDVNQLHNLMAIKTVADEIGELLFVEYSQGNIIQVRTDGNIAVSRSELRQYLSAYQATQAIGQAA